MGSSGPCSGSIPSSLSTTVAYFISPHGFGHAARSVAVMEELSRIRVNQRFQIFTTVLAAFAHQHLPCAEISADAFQRGVWIDDLAALLGSERPAPVAENGAKEIARHLDRLLES